jgi:hypothetical protein
MIELDVRKPLVVRIRHDVKSLDSANWFRI